MAQTSQLFRRHLPRGHVEGFQAAKHVWTCCACGFQRSKTPYTYPHTRKSPAPCDMCKTLGESNLKTSKWVHSASRSEAKRYAELVALQRQGIIRKLRHPPPGLDITSHDVRQEPWSQTKICTYTADFSYEESGVNFDWRYVVEDHKPRAELTSLAELLHTLVWHQHGIAIRVTYYKRNRIVIKGEE